MLTPVKIWNALKSSSAALRIAAALAPEPYWVPRLGVGAIVIRGDKVILGLRQGSHAAGKWAFTGGKVEFRETVVATAIRETLEENGVRIANARRVKFFDETYHPSHGRQFVTAYVVGETQDVPQLLEPDKCIKWQEFTWQQLRDREIELMEGVGEIVDYYDDLEALKADLF